MPVTMITTPQEPGPGIHTNIKCIVLGKTYCGCVATRATWQQEYDEAVAAAKASADAEFEACPTALYVPHQNVVHPAWKQHLLFLQDGRQYLQCPGCRKLTQVLEIRQVAS